MGGGRGITAVEQTAGTRPCPPSAQHFLPEPADSVAFSQAFPRESEREPDHSLISGAEKFL